MASAIEIRERQKDKLGGLLRIKIANKGKKVKRLQDEILIAIIGMEQEDVAYVEKLVGIKAID